VLLTAPDVSPKKDEMIAKEIQEMRDALQALPAAIEAGEVAGFQNGRCVRTVERELRGRVSAPMDKLVALTTGFFQIRPWLLLIESKARSR
jgi:hypothetical protein